MMPCVTVWFRPNGLPMASTHWPTRTPSLSPSTAVGKLSPPLSSSTATSDSGSAQTRATPKDAVVGQADCDLTRFRLGNDVIVGENEGALLPIGLEQHAGAGFFDRLGFAVPLRQLDRFDGDDARPDLAHDVFKALLQRIGFTDAPAGCARQSEQGERTERPPSRQERNNIPGTSARNSVS